MTVSYGKEAVSVYRIDGSALFAAEVAIEVFGENLLPAYTEGDNSLVVATDTMKNFVHEVARDYDGDSLDGFCAVVARRFLAEYGHVERIAIRGRELPFARREGLVFQRLYDDYGVAEIELDRSGFAGHRSGRRGLELVKLRGSAFAGFPRDEHTTLPERADRALFTWLDVWWRHADFERRVPSERVRYSAASAFDGFVSESIQHFVHELGTRLLAEEPEIVELWFEAQNRTWDEVELAAGAPGVKVLTDPHPPYGRITLHLAR